MAVPNVTELTTRQSLTGNAGAVFSPCFTYRYRLWREWAWPKEIGRTPRFALFIMLNPSKADEEVLDPTVRRCVKFARAWGFDGLEVCNLFALRSTDPKPLYTVDDPVGPDNDRIILERAAAASLVVLAWGNHGRLNARGKVVRELLFGALIQPKWFRLTKHGEPEHPLYLSADKALIG
jgi:hypothetical protein